MRIKEQFHNFYIKCLLNLQILMRERMCAILVLFTQYFGFKGKQNKIQYLMYSIYSHHLKFKFSNYETTFLLFSIQKR